MKITPHAQTIAAGSTQQYTGTLLDQFNHPIRTAGDPVFSIDSGDATITSDGLFTAGASGHVVIRITVDDLTGVLGATVT